MDGALTWVFVRRSSTVGARFEQLQVLSQRLHMAFAALHLLSSQRYSVLGPRNATQP